jgi:anti-sigma factor RsiW
MKPTAPEDQMTRWVDGELSEEEARALLQAHPEAHAERESAQSIGYSLRAAFSDERDIPYADFFNHQIRRRIGDDVFSRETEPAGAESEEPMKFPIFQRLRWISAAGFVLTLGALIGLTMRQGPEDISEVVSTYTPTPGATATSLYDADAGATVIRLEGVPPIPASVVIGGVLERAGRVIFSLNSRELGCPISVLAGDNPADEFPGAMLVQF